ncbi:MAG: hypothetical protein HZA60_10370 [Deltaproteobacteria bacterium]|nr:hypothetical protein [Deltaproteobacteria bacterium]
MAIPSSLQRLQRFGHVFGRIPEDKASEKICDNETRIKIVYDLDEYSKPVVISPSHFSGTSHLDGFKPFQVGEEISEAEREGGLPADCQR